MISPRGFLLFCGLLAMAAASGSFYPYSSQYNYQPYQNYGNQPSSYQYNYQQFPYQYNYQKFPYQYNYQQFPYQYNYQQFPYQNFQNYGYQPVPYGGPVANRFPWGIATSLIPYAIDFIAKHV